MRLDAVKRRLLNLLGKHNPALNDPNKTAATSNVLLGDIIDEMSKDSVRTREATYDFAVHGGLQGTIPLGVEIPAGAIVTRVVTRMLAVFTSTGLADVAIKAGTVDLKALEDFDHADYTGVVEQRAKDALAGDPALIADASELALEIATEDLTDGKMRIIVEYIEA